MEKAEEDYDKLKNKNMNEITSSSKEGNKFVDYFTFLERLETVGKTGINFFDFLSNKSHYEKKAYIKNLLNHQGNKDMYKKWYNVFSLYFSSISIFKPVIAMEIYNKYKPKSILDFTMGWGGRLVGACALNIPHYIGIDLNTKLKKPYEDMTEELTKLGSKTKIDLYFKDALSIDYSKLNYDMVFTSPPYYNIEIYNGTKKQSKEEWNENFYIPIFTKTYKHMKHGYYILNIPIEVYETVCIPLFGKADILFELKKQKRNKSKSKDGKDINIKYKEYIYIWKK